MLEIIQCTQGDDVWHVERSQIVTASNMGKVLAKGEGKTRAAYAKQIAAARHTGAKTEGWAGNEYTERGHEQEGEAGELYAAITGLQPSAVGFLINHQDIGSVGYSPDLVIDDNIDKIIGLAEIKTKKAELQIDVLRAGKVPGEHVAQCQTGIWVAEVEWLDFVCYCRGMPPFLKRIYRDDVWIKTARDEVIKFYFEVDDHSNFLINYDAKRAWI